MYKPELINMNAVVLLRIKMKHFNNISKFVNKIFAFNNSDSESTDTADDKEIHIDEIDMEFKNFTELYQTTSLMDYSKIEYTNTQF